MKAAIISDVHGNSPALEAVLSDIDVAGTPKLYVLGDVANGFNPKRCLELLYNRIDCQCIKGNAEHYFCTQDFSKYTRTKDHKFKWKVKKGARVRAEIGLELFVFMCSWPEFLHKGDAYFLHDSPWDRRLVQVEGSDLLPEFRDFAYHGRGALPWMDSEEMQEADSFIEEHQVRALFCGHTHIPFIQKLESGIMVNTGSVGMPLDQDSRASWIAWQDDDQFDIRRVEYDVDHSVRLYVSNTVGLDTSKKSVELFRRTLLEGLHRNDLS